jgi:hypothetical protein
MLTKQALLGGNLRVHRAEAHGFEAPSHCGRHQPTTEQPSVFGYFTLTIDRHLRRLANWSYLVITSIDQKPRSAMAPQASPQTGTVTSYGASSTVTDSLSCEEPRNLDRAAFETAACLVLSVNGADLAEVPLVRRDVCTFLTPRCATGGMLDAALLVTSELLTNAVVHALPPVILHIHCNNETNGLRIEVSDSGPRHASDVSEPDDEHGRGLEIVAALCVRHGTYAHTQGATYWAEVHP